MATSTPRLQGRIALVTGSTSGIGLAIAERIAQDGAKVIISSRSQENVDDTVNKFRNKGYDVVGIACHIGDKNQRKKLIEKVEEFGVLDIFVQSVGLNVYTGQLINCSEDDWDKTFDMNVKTTFLLTKELLHLLKNSKCGRVIYMGSTSAYTFLEILGVYSVSKVALLGLTKNLAVNLGRYNITVNCIVPGVIDTKFANILKTETIKTVHDHFSALKRFGKPEEVAGIAAFLASHESSFITGESLGVSGGFGAKL